MLVSPWGAQLNSRQKPTETSAFEFSYKCVNSLLEELIKIKVIFILRQLRNVKVAKSQKIVETFLTQRIAFQAARAKRTRHAKTWTFNRPLLQNEEPFRTENL